MLKRFIIWYAMLFPLVGQAQASYKMSNGYAGNCKGTLTGSKANQVSPGKYANNEDLIFHVCVEGASSIRLKFAAGSFCTEKDYDFLKIYKGSDTTGTLVGRYHGSLTDPGSNVPPSLLSVSDSCVTFYFHSDKSKVCDGWDMNWESIITSVPQPKFNPITNPTCNSTKITVTFDKKFNCDSLKPANFKLSGTLNTAVSGVTGKNCDGKNESSTFEITFASGLNQSGNYTLDFNSTFKDRCDSIWKINAKLNFSITDCPIKVVLNADSDTICKGTCTTLRPTVSGGNKNNYVYSWTPGTLSGAGNKVICPAVSTRYILQVSDGVSIPGADTVDITVLDPPAAQNDTIVCQSSPPFSLKATPSGGKWSGTGITNAVTGVFDPALSKAGSFKVAYSSGGCSDTVIVTVRAINAGPPNASCPGAAAFFVTNFSPTGGTWTGSNITSAGLYTPPSVNGSYKVTYNWNGCTADKIINIGGVSIVQEDTICKSKQLDTLLFSPVGGIWSGPGFTDAIKGIFSPPNAGPGLKRLVYSINGCKDTLMRYVQDIDARWDEISCPTQDSFFLPAGLPAGGYWTGEGIQDSLTGLFNPKQVSFVQWKQVNLNYHFKGCTDTKIMYMRYTRFYTDTVKYCIYDTAVYLRWASVLIDPWNSIMSGSGVTGTSAYYQKFSPALAGYGVHQVIANAYQCRDTLMVVVHPRSKIQNDTTVCIADTPFKLYNGEGKGTWSGPGITNAATGLFNPATAGAGLKYIRFTLPGKCTDTVRITVTPLPTVTLTGLAAQYCLRDTGIILKGTPAGGTYSGNGLSANVFNPRQAGTGSHTIQYTYGSGKCISIAKQSTDIADTLQVTLTSDKDSICIGTNVQLSTTQKGGMQLQHNLQWSSGQNNVQNIFVSPGSTTIYRVILTDACSDPDTASVQLYVHPRMGASLSTSAIQCYGNKGFASITMNVPGSYSYKWNTVPAQTTATVTAPVSNTYKVTVTNNNTGCLLDTFVTIPGYKKIRAAFTTIPAGTCLFSTNPMLQIINLSEGGIAGTWYYGDSSTESYNPLYNPFHLYAGDKESYTIRLIISNEGGCVDSASLSICIIDTATLFVPNAFSPGFRDGINDVFKVQSASVKDFNMEIYNRWGEKVFATTDINEGWDGTYGDILCPTGYYLYRISYKGKKTARKYLSGPLFLIR